MIVTIKDRLKRVSENPTLSYGILFIVCVFMAVISFDKFLHTNGDNAIYIILGEAIADGDGYKNMHAPAESFHSQYPPIFPLLIAITHWITPGTIVDYKILVTLFYVASVLACYWAFSPQSKLIGFLLAIILALNFEIVSFGHWVMSEIPSMFFAIMTVGFLQRITKNNYKPVVIAGLFCAIGLLTRSALIFLVPSGLLFLIINKQWKESVVFGISSIGPLLFWGIIKKFYGVSAGGYGAKIFQINPYRPELGMASLGDLVQRLVDNFLLYSNSIIPSMTFPTIFNANALAAIRNGQGAIVFTILAILITIILVAGIINGIRKKNSLIVSITVCGCGILLIWPSVWTTQRFVIPMLPFLLLIGTYGFSLLKNWDKSLWIRGIVFISVIGSNIARIETGRSSYPVQFAQYKSASQWIKRNSDKTDIISCRKGEFTYLFSDRKCVRYKYSLKPDEVAQHLVDNEVKYVIVDQLGFSSTPRYLVPAVKKYPELFKLVYVTQAPENYVLEFKYKS